MQVFIDAPVPVGLRQWLDYSTKALVKRDNTLW
jgi:hypothetical protein